MKVIEIIDALWLIAMLIGVYLPVSSEAQGTNRGNAEQIWERMIAAKGGREKLRSVETILAISDNPHAQKTKNHSVDLIVLPNKWWSWVDNRPEKFGLRMTMYDFDDNTQYVVQSEGLPREWGLEAIQPNNRRFAGMPFIAYLLPENRYLHPKLERLITVTNGSRDVYVIETRIKGNRVDFFLDSQTYLPFKLAFFRSNGKEPGEHVSYETNLADYLDCQGIKVPTKVDDRRVSYQFNTEYNEQIFRKVPLPIEKSGDAWRSSKSSPN